MRVPKDKVEQVVREFQNLPEEKRRCVTCGHTLYRVRNAWEGQNQKDAWLYSQCVKCGYQNALWKVFKRAGLNYPKEIVT